MDTLTVVKHYSLIGGVAGMDTLIVMKYYSLRGGGGRHRHFNCDEALFSDRRG